jgi:hypothetical protein
VDAVPACGFINEHQRRARVAGSKLAGHESARGNIVSGGYSDDCCLSTDVHVCTFDRLTRTALLRYVILIETCEAPGGKGGGTENSQ